MEFTLHERIILKHTGESGRVTGVLDGGMYNIRLDNDASFEIPAFAEDMRTFDFTTPSDPTLKDGRVKSFAQKVPTFQTIQVQYIILKPIGLQVGFEAKNNREGIPVSYDIWLVNDTKNDLAIEAELYVDGIKSLQLNQLLKGSTAMKMGSMLADSLNDNPEFEILCQRLTTAGPSNGIEKVVRIRAKQFFKNLATAPVLNIPLHLFLLFDAETLGKEGDQEQSANDAASLLDYTKLKVEEHKNSKKNKPVSNSKRVSAYDVDAYVNFSNEIDLHIQNLVNGHASMSRADMVRIQMKHFERYMHEALRLGVHRVFIIHGVGEGKLKDAVASRLKEYKEVKKFKNEYHAKYGYGATEVIFEW